MAEGILRTKLAEQGLLERVLVDSAGTSSENAGRRADARARIVMRRHGTSIAGLRARPLKAEDIDRFDLIVAMDESNKSEVLTRFLTDADVDKVRLLLEFTGGGQVPDPVSGTTDDFERTYDVIDRACDEVLAEIASHLDESPPAKAVGSHS
jgi:protein-tyrosine phosphatase